MTIFSKVTNKIRRMSAKQTVIAGVFVLAMAGAAGLGLAAKQNSEAATIRDCSKNSIDYVNMNGGCGALNRSEFIADVKDNRPSDLKPVYAHTGLSSSDYSRFANSARSGVIKKNGDVVVDGQVVMRDAWTMGRTTLNGAQRTPITINGKTYYHSHPSASFGRSELDVMVLFNSKGTVEFAVLEACGNPVTKGDKVQSGADCKSLTKTAVSGKLNTYSFTTSVSTFGLAKIEKVEYFLDGKKFAESKDKSSKFKVTETFTKSGTIEAKVVIQVPGKQTRVIASTKCRTTVEIKQPFYVCEELTASVIRKEDDETTYRFVAVSRQGNGATLKNADFIVNGTPAATGVTSKTDGNIYREITLEGGQTYTVEAKVHFTLNGKTVTAKEICKTTVTPEKEEKPFYACDLLRATAVDEELRKFRFTVEASFGNGATLKDADFSAWVVANPDDKMTVTGVTQKDTDGNIYQEFEFEADGQERIVEATVNFNVKDGVKSVKCQAKVTPEKQPVCPLPGKEHLPPDSPECKEPKCPIPGKEHLPKDSDECVEEPEGEVLGKETELPKTGAASVLGIFASATGAGAAAHRLVTRRLQK